MGHRPAGYKDTGQEDWISGAIAAGVPAGRRLDHYGDT